MKSCLICRSEIKNEIDVLIKNGVNLDLIAGKYYRILGGRKNLVMEMLKEHKKNKHYMVDQVVVTEGVKKIHDYDSSADDLLQKGMNDESLEYLSAEKKIKLAATLKKVAYEGKKLQLGENALKLQVAKFLGGFLEKPKDGELTSEGDIPSIQNVGP